MLYCKPPFAFQCHMGYGGKTSMAGWVLVFFFSKQTLDLWNQCQHHITKHANNILFNAVDAWRSTAHAGWISWLIIIFSSNIYCIWMYMMMLPFNPPFIVDFPICSYVFLFFSNLSCMSPYFHPLAICPPEPPGLAVSTSVAQVKPAQRGRQLEHGLNNPTSWPISWPWLIVNEHYHLGWWLTIN